MGMTISEGLKKAWTEAKAKASKIKFENHMTVTTSDGYVRELTRWTKGGYDRVYINGGSRSGDGFVDIKTGFTNLRGNLTYQKEIAHDPGDGILKKTIDTSHNQIHIII